MKKTELKYQPHLMVGDYHPVANPYICYMSDESTMQSGSGDAGASQSGDQGGESSGGDNNSGQDDIYGQLFNDQSGNSDTSNGGQSSSPSSDSNNPTDNQNQNQNQNDNSNATAQLDQFTSGLSFGEGLTQDDYTNFANGDLEGFNNMIQNHGRNVVKQVLPLVANMMQTLQTQMSQSNTDDFQKMIDTAFESRETNETIAGAFGFENNPTMQNIAMQVYKGVLPRVNNDKTKAIETTKTMLKRMNEDLTGSLNVGNPPDGAPMNMGRNEESDFSELFGGLPKT